MHLNHSHVLICVGLADSNWNVAQVAGEAMEGQVSGRDCLEAKYLSMVAAHLAASLCLSILYQQNQFSSTSFPSSRVGADCHLKHHGTGPVT
jgi:hypothetical protein